MSFLDDLISDQQFNPNVDQGLLARIEQLIWHSSLDEKQKAREMKRMLNVPSIEEALKMVKFLEDFQPIIGRDRTAITQYEISKAVKDRVDLDDFQERRKNL